MQKEPDWFQLLFEHTHRQGNIAGVQIILSFFVLGFVWRDETPWGAVVVMFGVYLFCAAYLINSLYRIQDRRITLWRYITINELGHLPDENKLSPKLIDLIKEFRKHYFEKQDANDKESDKKKLRENYIKKLSPAPKSLVLKLHTRASAFALMIILISLGYKIYKLFYQ